MDLIKEELLDLKEEVLKQKKANGKIVLTGKKPIMLATTLYEGETEEKLYEFFQQNNIDNSFLDVFIYKIYKEMGVHGVIDYKPIRAVLKNYRYNKEINHYYYDKKLRKYFNKYGIDAFYVLNIERFLINRETDKACLHEHNSSFSFMGLTGITRGLTDMFDEAHIDYHTMFGGGMSLKELNELNIQFTDDTILYNKLMKIGRVKNKKLERQEMWPRTLDISLSESFDLETFAEVFTEYLEWVNQELTTKGTYEAMSPMLKKM